MRSLIAAGVLTGIVLLWIFLWQAIWVLLLIFAGILVAILLDSITGFVQRITRLRRGWSLLITIVLLAGLFAGFAWLAAPQLIEQADQLSRQLPEALKRLRGSIERYGWAQWVLEQSGTTQSVVQGQPEMLLRRAGGIVTTTLGFIASAVVVMFVGIYLAAEPELYINGVVRLVPLAHRRRAREIMDAVGYTLRWWLAGQLLAMTVVGLLTTLGLWLMGVPLAMTLGLLAFLLDFVPNFGPLLAATPAILLAMVTKPTMVIYVALLYLVVQSIEGYLVTPLIQRRTVSLPPVLTITAQVLLGLLVGPIGVLLATPLAAAALVLVKMLYVEEMLGDEIETPDDRRKDEQGEKSSPAHEELKTT